MSSKLMLALFVTAVLMTSIAAVTIPAASALTSRSSFNDNHYTALYPGGPRICGDHICAPGEYDKMQEALAQAQMKGKAGSTAPTTPTPPTTTPTPPTTTPTPPTTTPTPPTTTPTPPVMPSTNNTSTTAPSMNSTSTKMPAAMSVCDSVKATLTTAGTSSTVIAKVMADLSCS